MSTHQARTRLDPHQSLGFHCNLTHKAFVTALTARLQATEVSPVQYLALAYLVAEGPLAQAQLADRLSITPATAVRLVDRLERDGWLRRQPDPGDARVKRLVLTPKAEAVCDRVSRIGRNLLATAYRGIRPAEVETVKRILAQVRRNLGG